MSMHLYDNALVEKLREITRDTRIRIVPPEQAILYFAQFDKDKVEFPAIILSRGPVSIVGDLKNQAAILKGQTTRINPDNTASKVKLIPIHIEWDLNVYAVDRFTCDEIIRELVFYLTTYPRFNVRVPYDLDIDQNFDVFLQSDITDNSDLISFPDTGEYFRETLRLYTDNAHLYSSGKLYLTKVRADVEDKKEKFKY